MKKNLEREANFIYSIQTVLLVIKIWTRFSGFDILTYKKLIKKIFLKVRFWQVLSGVNLQDCYFV